MPETDPHGDPIPDSNLDLPQSEDVISLVEIEESASVEVTRILTQDDEVLEYLVSIGLEPTERLHLNEITPIGMMIVTIGDASEQTSLPRRLASQILVAPLDDQ
jgi:FeoA domain.